MPPTTRAARAVVLRGRGRGRFPQIQGNGVNAPNNSNLQNVGANVPNQPNGGGGLPNDPPNEAAIVQNLQGVNGVMQNLPNQEEVVPNPPNNVNPSNLQNLEVPLGGSNSSAPLHSNATLLDYITLEQLLRLQAHVPAKMVKPKCPTCVFTGDLTSARAKGQSVTQE